MIKSSIDQEDITIINIYAPNGEIHDNTIIVGEFSSPLTVMDRLSRHKNNKKTLRLNHILEQMGLTDIYRTFHSKAAENTLFSNTHGTFSKIDHIVGHKTNLSKFEKTEIPTVFSDHKVMKSTRGKWLDLQICGNQVTLF